MRDLDKELSILRTKSAICMFFGWVAGASGAGILWGWPGTLMGVGFPVMYFGFELATKVIEAQVAGK